MEFLDVKTDYAFKKVFGSENSKDILISFLNAVVDFQEDNKIKDLTIIDPYNVPLLKGMKDTYVDVKAILNDNTKVIIEMQVLNWAGFEKRILYNAAKNYSMQLKKGELYTLLNPVVALTITDFVMFEKIKEMMTFFKLLEKKNFVEYSDDIELIFIELPKFKQEEAELETITDKWIYFIKNAGSLEFVPKSLAAQKEIKAAFEIANQANMSEEELEIQQKKRDFIYIQKGSIELAKEQGLEQGIEQGLAQGLAQGRKQEALEIAKRLLDILDDETISQKTGLSVSEIEKLRK